MYAPEREPIRDPDERLGRWILVGFILIALAVGLWLWQRQKSADTPEAVTDPPVAAAGPGIEHPIETPAGTDPELSAPEAAAKLVGEDKFQAMFVPEDFVRKVVATVDNLARPKIATRMNPAKPPAGDFAIVGSNEEIVLGAANYERYARWIELVDALDAETTVELYRRMYPQLQAAYESLGNPDGYFNDRVIEILDHLIATPTAPETIVLKQPNVYYEFADPMLEAESSGRKLLFRMGPGNAARVKAKLRDIRNRIAS
ncbi:MAG: DUF3014 domain-containing protein [Pseudomonadota bacterium]|nr:DUF3014 domain-containing protein [Pseudomonadota bacterium]